MTGPVVLQFCIILNDMPTAPYRLGEVSSFWRVWGYNWEDWFGASCLR